MPVSIIGFNGDYAGTRPIRNLGGIRGEKHVIDQTRMSVGVMLPRHSCRHGNGAVREVQPGNCHGGYTRAKAKTYDPPFGAFHYGA